MADLDLTITVLSEGLDDFVIGPVNGYRILRGGFGPGGRVWNRQTAESPFTHGHTLVGRTLAMSTAPLVVQVFATDSTILAARIDALVGVLERFTYELQVEVDGLTYRWQCETADSVPGDGGVFVEYALMSHFQTIAFAIPRHPIPLEGPL